VVGVDVAVGLNQELGTTLPVRTFLVVDAAFRDAQPLHRFPPDDVLFQYHIDIRRCHLAVPYRFRVNDYIRTVLALIQASGFVGTYSCFQTHCTDLLFEELVQVGCAFGLAASTRSIGCAEVSTYEDVVPVIWHDVILTFIPPFDSASVNFDRELPFSVMMSA